MLEVQGYDLALAPYVERRTSRLRSVDRYLNGWASRIARLTAGLNRRHRSRIDRIEAEGLTLRSRTDSDLAKAAARLRPELLREDVSGRPVEEAFALVRETTYRQLGLRHHRVQLLGGLVMVNGGLAEMQTGEGKTITALLPAISYALSGRPVHVVTVNDYLAKRDAEQLRCVYEALGLTVGIVQSGQTAEQRRAAYAADVTYCTNKELVFDYLKDRLAVKARPAAPSQPYLLRGLSFAIVDEADSVLIDEAQTPLIIAAEQGPGAHPAPYAEALQLARELSIYRHFYFLGSGRLIELTEEGRGRLADLARCITGPWKALGACEQLVKQGLSALYLYQRDRHYIIVDGKIQIVDESTGRVMADRTWQHGLHQMIEVKENLTASGQRTTLAQITYQRFFRRYIRLAGMSGTVREVAGELRAVYGLSMRAVPTHRASRRLHLGSQVFKTQDEKWTAVAVAVEREVSCGRAVLVGTRSVAASETLSRILTARGTAHVVLNARQDIAEAEIIAAAGSAGRVTVATNMAGRGTDIHLNDDVRQSGGLHVILTEFHESARIDRQLYGRAGRQGDPGTCEVIASLDDEIFRRFSPLTVRLATPVSRYVPQAVLGTMPRALAQSAAERVGRRIRGALIDRDQQLDRSFFFSGDTY